MNKRLVSYILICCLFYSILAGIQNCSAQEDQPIITLVDTSYIITKIEETGGRDYIFFNISIIMKNSGEVVSENMTIFVEDDQGFYYRQYHTFQPGEQQILKNDWFVTGLGQHRINVSYYPTDPGINLTQQNSGDTFFYVQTNGDGTGSTPGFEFILAITALAVIFLFIRKKRK